MAEYRVDKGGIANGELVRAWKVGKLIDKTGKWKTSIPTYSYNIAITIVQVFVVPM